MGGVFHLINYIIVIYMAGTASHHDTQTNTASTPFNTSRDGLKIKDTHMLD